MGGVTKLSWGDIYFMGVLCITKPHFKKSISNFFPKGAREQKNRLKIRRHKQKVKTENPDFVQNGFIKVGIVCEIFRKNSIDKKSCRTVGSPKQNQRGKKNSHRLHSTIQKKALQDVNCKARESVYQ